MNIEEKTKLADSYFQGTMSYIRKFDIKHNFLDVVAESWEYADAMEAEADKRIKAEAEKDAEDAKVFFEKLSRVETQDKFISAINEGVRKAEELEWQPDWSVSPKWANYWSYTNIHGKAIWLSHDVVLPLDGSKLPYDLLWQEAPSFNYQGNWKDSLRTRPDGKPKQHQCNCSHWKNSSFFMGDTFTCKDCGGSVTI